MKYELLRTMSHDEAVLAEGGTPEQLALAAITVALHDEDAAWAESFLTRSASHPSPVVRKAAMLGFAHLARRFGELSEGRVRPLIEVGIADVDAEVRGEADDAADDIGIYLKWRVTRPV